MEDGRPRLSSTTALARALSLLGHPFLLAPLTIAALTRSLFWAAVLAASTTVPLLLVITRNVRRGAWSDFDVSRHEQRSGLYYAGLPLMAFAAVLLYLLDASPALLRGVAAATVMFLLGLLGNRFLKISMHMMVAAFCTVALARAYPWSPLGTITFVAALAWSRRHLDRHTWPEIATGIILGAACALAA